MTAAISSHLADGRLLPSRIPQWVLTLIGATIATSFFVQIEPAPTDLLFVITTGMLLFTGRVALPALGKMCWLGVFLFVVGDLISISQVRYNLPGSLKFWAITQYMMISFVLYAGLLSWDSARAMSTILKTYYLATIIASGLAVLAIFKLVPFADKLFRDSEAIRICSTFKDPNVMAPFVIPGCMIAIWNLTQSKKNRLFHCCALGVTATAVLLAYSRAAWGNIIVAMSVYFVLFLVSSSNIKRNLNLFIVAVFGLAILFVLLIVLGNYLGHTNYLMSRLTLQGYDSHRFGNFASAIRLFESHPFGIGPGQSEHRLMQQVHCVYIGVLCESGVIGAIGFLLILTTTVHRAVVKAFAPTPNRSLNIMILAVLLGLLLNCVVVNSTHWRHFFLVLALPWASNTATVEPFGFWRSRKLSTSA